MRGLKICLLKVEGSKYADGFVYVEVLVGGEG